MREHVIVTDDNGLPVAAVDLDRIEAGATLLAYRLAVACDSPEAIGDVLSDALETHGPIFGQVATGALRTVVEHILAPVLEVTDRLADAGYLRADLRAGLADALANAEATFGGEA